jgi:hypothetical protein
MNMTEKRKPIHEIRIGGVKAAIWANQSEKTGVWHSVTLCRLYKQGESWKRSESFGPSELPLVSKIADMAVQWIQSNGHRPLSPEVDVTDVSIV